MNTRMQLLKIPEVLNIKCGKRVDPELQWPFFIAIDFGKVHGGNHQTEHGRFAQPGFRNGSGQRRAVFLIADRFTLSGFEIADI